MGSGQYDVTASVSRSTTNGYDKKAVHEVFTARAIERKMNPRNIDIRESRDSKEHPESYAIMIGLDVTGSMGSVPHYLLAKGLPHIMEKIFQAGEKDPQILFTAVGDQYTDTAPLQVGQYESSDELLEKWLKQTYVEGNGGGNGGESYHLAWYFAGNHTSIDCFEKRGRKGLLITIGDEPTHDSLEAKTLRKIMGDGLFEDLTVQEVLAKAQESYDVYHIHCAFTYSGGKDYVQQGWKDLMGENVIMVKSQEEVADTIARIAVGRKNNLTSKPSQGKTESVSEDIL